MELSGVRLSVRVSACLSVCLFVRPVIRPPHTFCGGFAAERP